jgi:hypothetical protein
MSLENIETSLQHYLNLVSPNKIYNDYRDRWQFLLESYMGGEEYRQAGHLTRYQLETNNEYQARLNSTPLDNHCRSVISVYISFLFREEPDREFMGLDLMPQVEDFCKDADLEGRSLDAFMKDVATWSSVFGHCWVMVTKPNLGAVTRADELAQDARPYVNLMTPLTVIDWTWTRKPNGRYQLTYLKYIEETNDSISTVKEWTETTIITSVADSRSKKIMERYEDINGLGRIPAVQVYSTRSPVRGIGASDITDIADQQKAIFNEYSEIEQQIRLQNHPALVKTPDTEAGAGAGAIIVMQDNLDPGLKPYLLEPSGNGLEKIYSSIDARIRAIDKMANTGGVRNTSSTISSGIALQTEFQLLNAKLSEKADQLELAEEQIWTLFAEYMGTVWSGEIDYPGSFNIRDTANEIDQLVKAKSAATDPVVFRKIDEHILEWMGEDSEAILGVLEISSTPTSTEGEHPSLANSSQADRLAHIQTMLMEGYSNDEILALHPELVLQDIIDAGAEAARNNN